MLRVKREKGEKDRERQREKERERVAASLPTTSNACTSTRREDVDDNVDGPPTPMPTQTASNLEDQASRRQLRMHYRDLKTRVNDRQGMFANDDMDEFKYIVDKAKKLHEHVKKPRESITDAELHLHLTTGVKNVAKGAQVKGGMSAAEFVGAIIHTYGLPGSLDEESGPSIDWEALGLEASTILRHAPGVSTMVGPMEVELKPRKVTAPRKREKPTERTRPESVKEVDADRPNTETDANMLTMFRIITDHKDVRLDQLILNRRSFAQTIENLFALSFLVKDGRVSIQFGDNNVQYVVPKNAPVHTDRVAGAVVNTQFVFRFDSKCWRLMTETVPEGEELMPNRGNAETPTENVPAARTPIRKNSRNRARETPVDASVESPEDGDDGQSKKFKRRLLSFS